MDFSSVFRSHRVWLPHSRRFDEFPVAATKIGGREGGRPFLSTATQDWTLRSKKRVTDIDSAMLFDLYLHSQKKTVAYCFIIMMRLVCKGFKLTSSKYRSRGYIGTYGLGLPKHLAVGQACSEWARDIHRHITGSDFRTVSSWTPVEISGSLDSKPHHFENLATACSTQKPRTTVLACRQSDNPEELRCMQALKDRQWELVESTTTVWRTCTISFSL